VGALLFTGAFFVVVAALAVRRAQAAWRARAPDKERVVAGFDDVDAFVSRARCACGRRFDKDGEGPRGEGRWAANLSCVCGRRRTLVFVVGN
jgi:hypothetical protein